MNASANPEAQHRAYICLGSNIQPEDNLRSAVRLLSQQVELLQLSTCWETEAVGKQAAPNFINVGACVATLFEAQEFKTQVLSPIEITLGRVRTADKYAPRTIDLDITVFDDQVLDLDLWRRVYLALIFSELLPTLRHPETGEAISEVAARLRQTTLAIPHAQLRLR